MPVIFFQTHTTTSNTPLNPSSRPTLLKLDPTTKPVASKW